ncbi:MAG: xanthine dehydrogenase family protein molybdopterin-binding subunit, partial [Alphaproteobacteria bacterium]|nr:xanthine dehydrogenase family protein molybdopterin-binding subunit [Alphaproteobacteria bacterium]
MSVGSFGISQPVRRVEDERLLTGGGRYSDDSNLAGQAYAAFLRSPFGHGDIRTLDVSAARAAPGVLGVWTGDDLAAAGVGPIPNVAPLPWWDGRPLTVPPRPALSQ